VDSQLIEFQQVAMQRTDLRKSEDVFNRVMVKDNIAVFTLLQSVEGGSYIAVANAHLHWDPAFCDVKLIQTALLLEEMERNLIKWNKNFSLVEGKGDLAHILQTVPVLFCGDFNSLPDSGVVELLQSGHVPATHPDLKSYNYSPLSDGGLNHKFELNNAYTSLPDMEFTNFTPTFKGVIDYVWLSSATLCVTGVLGRVDREYVARSVGFPNAHHPSDHIPLVVSLRRKTGGQTGRKVSFK
jgi:CCR4-NOT transcription complex subunit 6